MRVYVSHSFWQENQSLHVSLILVRKAKVVEGGTTSAASLLSPIAS